MPGHVLRALQAGKAVFVEKPLCISEEELLEIETALGDAGETAPLLMVGFNRRFSAAAAEVRRFFADADAPLTVSIRFNAGPLPADHWLHHEDEGGGRIIGEACHAIDLATFLVGSPPERVFAESIGGSPSNTADDQCFITLRAHRRLDFQRGLSRGGRSIVSQGTDRGDRRRPDRRHR